MKGNYEVESPGTCCALTQGKSPQTLIRIKNGGNVSLESDPQPLSASSRRYISFRKYARMYDASAPTPYWKYRYVSCVRARGCNLWNTLWYGCLYHVTLFCVCVGRGGRYIYIWNHIKPRKNLIRSEYVLGSDRFSFNVDTSRWKES